MAIAEGMTMLGFFGLAIAAIVAADPVKAPTLAERLGPLAAAHKGRVAISVRRLDSDESFRLDADKPMPTASLIKFPVMVEAYRQAAAKKIDLAAPVTLRAEDKVPGSGILTAHF